MISELAADVQKLVSLAGEIESGKKSKMKMKSEIKVLLTSVKTLVKKTKRAMQPTKNELMKPATQAAKPAAKKAKKAAADTFEMETEINKLATDVQKLLELDDAIVSQNKGVRKEKGMYQKLLKSIKTLEMKSLMEVDKAKRDERAEKAA